MFFVDRVCRMMHEFTEQEDENIKSRFDIMAIIKSHNTRCKDVKTQKMKKKIKFQKALY